MFEKLYDEQRILTRYYYTIKIFDESLYQMITSTTSN